MLVIAGGAVALLQPGLQQGQPQCVGGREVFSAVGRAVLETDACRPMPARSRLPSMACSSGIDTLVRGLPPHAQAELSQLLSLLASAGGRRALAGLGPSRGLKRR